MNPTHYPYPAALVTAAERYYSTHYTHYSTKHAEGYDLYLYHPDDPLQPKVMIREDVNGCQICNRITHQYAHDCNAWCCAYAWMVNVDRLEAA